MTTQTLKEPAHTYESLDAELHHKGTGKVMDKRKVGNNTWLVRHRGSQIVVQLHQTDILTFTPDNRVVLNASHWYTVTTKDRMNAFLGWGTVASNRNEWSVAVRFGVLNDEWGQREWIEATVPFSNGMTLDVRTHELTSHPDTAFTKIDDSLIMREASDLSRLLGKQTEVLEAKAADGTLVRDDLSYSLLLIDKYQQERRRLANQMRQLESAMDWASTRLEDAIEKATKEHSLLFLEQKEARENIPGQARMKDLL